MKDHPNILFAAFEAEPFAKTGGLGDVCGSLPAALNNVGCQARVIMPKFKSIPREFKASMQHVTDFRVDLSWRNQYCGIETLTHQNVVFYFVDNEYYFNRDLLYGYDDDGERVAFFSKAVVECLRYLPDFFPHVIHCHDWHAALVSVFLREPSHAEEKYGAIRTVFTIHNLKFQGVFPHHYLGDVLGLHEHPEAIRQLTQTGCINYMRGGLNYSDALTTVSPTYAQEICTESFGEHTEDILIRRQHVLFGILNGIDNKKYDPAADKDIFQTYDVKSYEMKYENKKYLQAELGLDVQPDVPLIVLISRLTEQKGLDLVTFMFDELMQEHIQIAILGVGDKKYEETFRYFADKYPKKVALQLVFNESLSKKFYAGADMILIPSLFEPCGLTQMIAMRYGTLPIVRETGGLKDSVKPYNQHTAEGNGFSFQNFNAHELLDTIRTAASLYVHNRGAWVTLMKNAFAEDFSWDASAEKYATLYQNLLK